MASSSGYNEQVNDGAKPKHGAMKAWNSCKGCCYASGACWKRAIKCLPLPTVCLKRYPFALKVISLFFGCVGMATSSSVYSSFAWQTPMRAILNQTETESNLVSTLGNLGMTLAFPAGMCYELFGGQMAATIAAVMYAVAYVFLWMGTTWTWRVYYAENKWIVDILYFLVGFGGSFTYMAAMMPNVDNFTFKQRGTVIGLLDASLSLGPTLLSILYSSAFTNGHTKVGEEHLQNLSGYFITVAFVGVFVNLCLVFLVGRVGSIEEPNEAQPTKTAINESSATQPQQQSVLQNGSKDIEADEASISSSTGAIEDKPPSVFSEYPFKEMNIRQLVFRWDFYFLLVQFVLSACLQLTYQSNIPTYLRSFHMNEYNTLFTVLNTVLQTVTKFAAGVISDLIAHAGIAPRAVVCLIPYALQTVFLIISAFYGDNFVIMILTCIFVGAANGCAWCMTPTLVGELFGPKYMGSNWGWTMVLTAALGFPFTIGFSGIYEAAIIPPGSDIYCYGLGCFTWSFIMIAGASLAVFIMVIGLTQNMYRNAAYRKEDAASRSKVSL